MKSKDNFFRGFAYATLLNLALIQISLIIAKFLGANITWLWVLSPTWMPALFVSVIVLAIILICLSETKKKKARKRKRKSRLDKLI